ncbi:MAG: Uma2 family endonuclease [Sphaerospermopsis sp.]|jgi:Uma2 family endonuclease|uniref:Uma2 family endonuclease n=1 Tax=Sphaerospermopsis sp. LEGE 00249 TaxID=1380707 RepID=UPI00164DC959|nr:Uma2 family endonuclease [Sphaerospermopsis sp. LEGE 00249]MBC5795927.1 Uma2 family endonuclease [Sphaerospermopsis sp. LEGE 00249]MEB3148116.1 Uma2 family endonuclease [Sphaerospermopsis sp.]
MYQTDPPIPAQETLPTMYDLPSEYVEDAGLPDEFHLLQPRLLTDTFSPPNYPPDQVFVASDLNLYYDTRNPLWYKRPDWFAVVGVSRLFDQRELRLSYVMWQEIIAPLVMVELLSPKTEKEDLGRTLREVNQPPTKWEVYERIVRVPYYIIFDRYTDKLQAFQLVADRYEEIDVSSGKIWMPGIELGLGLWQGSFEGIERLWLRWYDSTGNWVLTPVEKERKRGDKLAAKLRELGINPDDL